MSDILGPTGRPANLLNTPVGAPVSASDIALPVTQPIDITQLMRLPTDTALPSSASDEVPPEPALPPHHQSPSETPQAVQRWYLDGGAAGLTSEDL